MSKAPDLSEFYKLSRPKKPPCQIGFIKTQLAPSDAEKLEAAVKTDRGIITAAAIVEWLKEKGHDCNTSRVSNHARGVCTCDD